MKSIGCAGWSALAIAALLGTAAGALADGPHAEQIPKCKFLQPDGLGQGRPEWIGGCQNGLADGPGVIRVPRPGQLPALFAGGMHAGRPTSGVVDNGETSDFGPAVRFEGSRPVYADGRDQLVAGFRAAAAGATEAASRFRKIGNKASAEFYEKWGNDLRTAPDRPE